MADRPIIFSAPMILALLAGRKTQTRRLVPQPPAECGINYMLGEESWLPVEERTPVRRHFEAWTGPLFQNRPAGHLCGSFDITQRFQPRDRLWVRESIERHAGLVGYRADGTTIGENIGVQRDWMWERSAVPSIHMPRWASRLTLVVEGVKVERLQDISEEDAIAEGCPAQTDEELAGMEARGWYRDLWDSLHGTGAWDVNPWVVALTFRVVRSNIDAIEADELAQPQLVR
ncbi:MAG: hypothetical protein ACLGJC_25025 [Alphaproteobacteria bacterium]